MFFYITSTKNLWLVSSIGLYSSETLVKPNYNRLIYHTVRITWYIPINYLQIGTHYAHDDFAKMIQALDIVIDCNLDLLYEPTSSLCSHDSSPWIVSLRYPTYACIFCWYSTQQKPNMYIVFLCICSTFAAISFNQVAFVLVHHRYISVILFETVNEGLYLHLWYILTHSVSVNKGFDSLNSSPLTFRFFSVFLSSILQVRYMWNSLLIKYWLIIGIHGQMMWIDMIPNPMNSYGNFHNSLAGDALISNCCQMKYRLSWQCVEISLSIKVANFQ